MHELMAAVNGRKSQNAKEFEPMHRNEYEEMKRRFPDVNR